jgi:hypothetical protein
MFAAKQRTRGTIGVMRVVAVYQPINTHWRSAISELMILKASVASP